MASVQICKNFARGYTQGRNNVLLSFSKKVTGWEETLIIMNHSFHQKGFQKSLSLRSVKSASLRTVKYNIQENSILKLA